MTMQERVNQIIATMNHEDEMTLAEINELYKTYGNDAWELITAAFMIGYDKGRNSDSKAGRDVVLRSITNIMYGEIREREMMQG